MYCYSVCVGSFANCLFSLSPYSFCNKWERIFRLVIGKNNALFKKTPVVMLSSKDGLFDRARGRIVGSEQYLTKPFTKDELLGAIRRHVAMAKTA